MDKDLICIFCRDKHWVMGKFDKCRFSIDWDNNLRVDFEDNDKAFDFLPLNYCPMCGRKLKKE